MRAVKEGRCCLGIREVVHPLCFWLGVGMLPVKAIEPQVGSGDEGLHVPGSEQQSQRGAGGPCRQQGCLVAFRPL